MNMSHSNKLIIICGIPFSGKTTLSKKIASKKNWVRIDLDDIKFGLYGDQITDNDLNQDDWNKIYKIMYKRIRDQLEKGNSVVNDTGNFTKHERDLVRSISTELGINSIVVWVNTPESLARERLIENIKTRKRFQVSESIFNEVLLEMEPPQTTENFISYDSSISPEKWIHINKIYFQ